MIFPNQFRINCYINIWYTLLFGLFIILRFENLFFNLAVFINFRVYICFVLFDLINRKIDILIVHLFEILKRLRLKISTIWYKWTINKKFICLSRFDTFFIYYSIFNRIFLNNLFQFFLRFCLIEHYTSLFLIVIHL